MRKTTRISPSFCSNAPADFYGGKGGSTPLVALVTSGHPAEAGLQPDLVASFARSGQNVNGLDDDGMPIAGALLFRYPAAAHALAEAGARVDNAMVAAGLGQLSVLRSLPTDARPPDADPGVLNSCTGPTLDRTTTPAPAHPAARAAGGRGAGLRGRRAGLPPRTVPSFSPRTPRKGPSTRAAPAPCSMPRHRAAPASPAH